ncbi:hypothetical protein M5G22_15755 [Pseudomonas sp. TNT2022 ID233]|uniref:dermonecrotic toxin domain-containing protein n=1 Tax=Pseudomonas aphyarum TaxID=2942629 RepID=UPI0023611290|nr:DUF6543 domain-containing protein [Pseudomonas aphyarum]MDD1139011.1 hypothetical protein [Pseudomonas aphyarum]
MSSKEMLLVEERLGQVEESFVLLQKTLNKIPSFKALLQNVLLEQLQQLDPEIYISRTFINPRTSDIADQQPTGLIMDVFMECLNRGRAPVYDPAQYAVYDTNGSSDERDLIPGLEVAAIGSLIAEVLNSLAYEYSKVLDRYWSAPQGKDAKGRELPARFTGVQEVYADLFWQELQAAIAVQRISPRVGESLETFIKGKIRPPAFSLSLQRDDGLFSTLACCFVMRLNGDASEELVPAGDGEVVLYTPIAGLELFANSVLMQQSLEQRLSDETGRARLLKCVAQDDAKIIRNIPDMRYLRINGELFDFFIANLIKNQRRDIADELRNIQAPVADLPAMTRSIESFLRMDQSIEYAKSRIAHLLAQVSENARPQWLKDAPSDNQEIFASLEKELLKSQVALHEVMDGTSSYHEYVRGVVANHVSQGAAEPVDPDTIWVSVKHWVRTGGKKIEHVERKTLTQLFMYGVHDAAGKYSIQFEAFHNNPRLSAPNIELAIRQFDLRLQYANERTQRLDHPHTREAMREVLGQQTAVSNFAAVLQKHLSLQGQEMVQRYLYGDPAMDAFGVAFRSRYRPFKDMIVYRAKGPQSDRAKHVLYAPGAPSGQQWYELSDFVALQRQFIAWGFEQNGREFLTGQVFAMDRASFVADELSYPDPAAVYQPWWWNGVRLIDSTPWAHSGPLMSAVENLINWEVAEEQLMTPAWYRNAASQDRELFTRLNTDLKAIHQVSRDHLHIESLGVFSRKLVMKALNDYLSRSAPHPHIDPDRVHVKLKGQEWMTLTHLFIQWQLWRNDSSVFDALFAALFPLGSLLSRIREVLMTATFESLDHAPLGQLSPSTLNALIDVLPGEKYEQYLRSNFLDTPALDLKARLYCKSIQNQMLRAALTQKMQGSLSANQFSWLQGLIEGLDHDRPVSANSYQLNPVDGVNTLSLEGQHVEGGYTFARTSAGRQECLIYIPNAVDGRMFRPLEVLTEGLRNGKFGEQVIGLVRLAGRENVRRFVVRCQNASGPALETPRLRQNLEIKHFRSEYIALVNRLLDDVDHQTTTRAEFFWNQVLVATELVVDVISLFVPPVGLVASIVRITRSIVQGIIAYSQGDDEAGKAYLASAWRSTILLYVGIVAGVGNATSAVGLLTRIRDISDIVSSATGVPVGIGYVTAMTSNYLLPQSQSQIID